MHIHDHTHAYKRSNITQYIHAYIAHKQAVTVYTCYDAVSGVVFKENGHVAVLPSIDTPSYSLGQRI